MEQVKDGQWRSTVREAVIAIALLVACLGLNVYECLQLRLRHNVPMWVEQAIPVALSNLEFDHPSDYTGLTGVNHHFYHIAKEPSARTVNAPSATRSGTSTSRSTAALTWPVWTTRASSIS